MVQKERRPGDPDEEGFGKPPKGTRFNKAVPATPRAGRRRSRTFTARLTKVLRENITRTVDGQPEKVTVQQALLLRLRDQALLGELWAENLLQKVVAALPDSGSDDRDFDMSGMAALFWRVSNESARQKSEAAPDAPETTNAE